MNTSDDKQSIDTLYNVVSTLEEEIALGVIYPRERITEDLLIERFNVSRYKARKVINELETMALVEREKNIGAKVKSFSVEEVEQFTDLRKLLEDYCASLISFPICSRELDELTELQRQHDYYAEINKLRKVFRINLLFHHRLFSLSNNNIVVSAISDYTKKTHSFRSYAITTPDSLKKSREDHWLMIEALRNQDSKGLRKQIIKHVSAPKDIYIAVLNRTAI